MMKRPFFGFERPKLKYPAVLYGGSDTIVEIPLPHKATLLIKDSGELNGGIIPKEGDSIKSGQRLKFGKEDQGNLISTVTGTIAGISSHTGYLGQTYTMIHVDLAEEDEWDQEFNEILGTGSIQDTLQFLSHLPGDPEFARLLDTGIPADTIIVNGIDDDLFVAANQITLKMFAERLSAGIDYLKKSAPSSRIIMVVPPDLSSEALKTGAEVKVIRPAYPNTADKVIVKDLLGKVVPAGRSCEDLGIRILGAEPVSALSEALLRGQAPVNKLLTVIDKDCRTLHVRVRIGTPVRDVLNALNIKVEGGDQLVLGGPMKGVAIYSEDFPVLSDTEAIMVQDRSRITSISDSHCINCGECVRACPAKVPVNMLIRLLENRLYEDAVEQYDLLSCVECGLCSYVCVVRIPVFHYIMLGKHEFARLKGAEEINA
jgi:electron transport complex protein RnfC